MKKKNKQYSKNLQGDQSETVNRLDNKPLPNPCPQHKRVKMNQFERNQNIEKLFNQFMEKCKTGYYRKIGVTWKKNGAVFNNSVLDAYNKKHNKDEEKRI